MRVRVFLRQPLFTLGGDAEHVPPTAMILEGSAAGDPTPFGATFTVEKYFDERGRPLDGKPRTLIVPGGKIDHVWVL